MKKALKTLNDQDDWRLDQRSLTKPSLNIPNSLYRSSTPVNPSKGKKVTLYDEPLGPPSPSNKDRSWTGSKGYPRTYVPNENAKEDYKASQGFMFDENAPSLEQFIEMFQSSSNNSTANQQAALTAARAQALATIKSANAELATQIEANRGNLDARYTQGIADQTAATQNAVDDLIQGNTAAQSANAEMFKNLGLEIDTSSAADELANATGTITSFGQNAGNQMRGNQLSAYQLGSGNMDAARMRGVEDLSAYEQNYQAQLAQLLDEAAQQQRSDFSSAMSAYGNSYSQWADRRDFAYDDWLRQNTWAREDAQNALEYEMSLSGQNSEQDPADALIGQLLSAGASDEQISAFLNEMTDEVGAIDSNGVNNLESYADLSPVQKAYALQYMLSQNIYNR